MKPGNKLLVLILALAFISGCATSGTSKEEMKPLCVLAGAVAGGAAGNAAEDNEGGAVVGAVAGGIIAWLWCDKDDDEDGDGVADSKDRCLGTPRGTEVDSTGCALDRDGDGVPDTEDKCPNTPRGSTVDRQGCLLDADGDGVTDDKDQCPSTPAGAKVDRRGCELDSDGDGVVDSVDQCPDTPAGATVNDRGCHTILRLEGVGFKLNSAELNSEAKSELNSAVKILKDDPSIKLRVEGHTDDSGAESYNLQLSQRRAEAVVDYLVQNGIDRGRLTAKGFGEASPIAGNDTREGRARNRRVDLVRM